MRSAEKNNGMGWLAFGVLYSIGYAAVGLLLRGQPAAWSWFRAVALLIPPMTGAVVVFTRRHTWRGCQWLFWATIALGLTMSAIGLTGWAADELIFSRHIRRDTPGVFRTTIDRPVIGHSTRKSHDSTPAKTRGRRSSSALRVHHR